MKGDFSRYTFDPKKHYAQVLMQQGRVVTDADWNEQQAIQQYRTQIEAKDVIGPCGVPVEGGGFATHVLPTPFDRLRDITFINDKKGWAIGDRGIILSTANAGQAWIPQPSGIGSTLQAVTFINSQQGWVVGNNGVILATTDGGQTWLSQLSGSSQGLLGISLVNSQNGWVVGQQGTILSTRNGGETWQLLESDIVSSIGDLRDVYFITAQIGWAVGNNGTILHTGNGGQTWQQQDSGVEQHLIGILFVTDQLGWVVGNNGTILHTENGGQTWQQQESNVGNSLFGVDFLNSEQGWAVGTGGTIIYTEDGGASWNIQSSDLSETLDAVHFVNPQLGWIVGERGAILNTAPNTGEAWLRQFQPGELVITPGRIYVDGILCQTDGFTLSQQPNLPDFKMPQEPGIYLLYLDVWKRHLTYLDDSSMREVALGGADTTSRLKIIWQVKLFPILFEGGGGEFVRSSLEDLGDQLNLFRSQESRLENQAQLSVAISDLETLTEAEEIELSIVNSYLGDLNFLLNKVFEGWTGEQSTYISLRILISSIEENIQTFIETSSISCSTKVETWDTLTKPDLGALNVRTAPIKGQDNPCLISSSSGYRRLENQLYRVEVHQSGELTSATFKWSRDNGSVVTRIVDINSQEVTVTDLGRDTVLGFVTGQWVEITDDVLELHGQPGQLAQIVEINAATRVVTLSIVPSGIDLTQTPKLRRWDSEGDILVETPTENEGWIQLEGGIEIHFSEGTYRTGDYWLIPARTATGEIEWPPYEVPNTNPLPQRPLGIQHHYCRLALVAIAQDGQDRLTAVQDCRRFFRPLTRPSAMHVTAISWQNDSAMALDNFINQGLRIDLDTTPDLRSINRGTLVVTMEVPQPFLADSQSPPSSETSPDAIFVLDGTISYTERSIFWRPLGPQIRHIIRSTEDRFSDVDESTNYVPNKYLIRVLLKGHKVWSASVQPRLYLDGQVFGQPAAQDAVNGAISLIFPSGDNQRASSFDSWFYLAKPVELVSLNIAFPKSVREGGSILATVTISGPAPAEGVEITLRRTAPTVGTPVTIPPTVTVLANAVRASFAIAANSVSTDTSVTIEAALRENREQDSLEVIALPQLIRLTVSPNEVNSGNNATGRVFLSKEAPPGGAVINLRSSNSAATIAQSTVTVTAGAAQAAFEISTPETTPFPGNSQVTATISASYRGRTLSQALLVAFLI